jgi:hypothetical protein
MRSKNLESLKKKIVKTGKETENPPKCREIEPNPLIYKAIHEGYDPLL